MGMTEEEKLANNLVKVVTITEWNALQNTLGLLQNHINTLSGAIQNTNKQEEK